MTHEDYLINIEKLNSWTRLYDEGTPEVSDKEWDDLYFAVAEYERQSGEQNPRSPLKGIHFDVVSKLTKVEHNHPMLSLDKTKEIKDVLNFLRGEPSIAMLKMDGLTCSLRYKDGYLVSAETRGNGLVGEDITHNIHFVKGVPEYIGDCCWDEVIVDGEIICTYKDFEDFSNTYKNPRNFASGSIRLLDSLESAKRKLTFVAWDCIKGLENETNYLTAKLDILEEYGFIIVPNWCCPNSSEEEIPCAIQQLRSVAEELSFPIDGIVFKFNDCKYYQSLGSTAHHFNGGLAYKFYDETYSTILRGIDWTMGRTGQLTPTAIFDPVDIDGTIVERASLHNVSVMRQILGPCAYYGEPLEIYKANQIIPQVYSAGPHYDYGMVIGLGGVSVDNIEKCPVCGSEVEFRQDGVAEICYCTNPNCEGKLINKLDHFCGKKGMDIKGLSKATLLKLINWEWVQNFYDIYNLNLHRSEWIKKSGFGPASVDKILNAIEDSRHTELWRVIAAAGIPEIGVSASRVLARYYKTWDAFRHAVFMGEDFSHLPDFGMVMNDNIHNYDFEVMDDVASHMIFAEETAAAAQTDRQALDGLQFCITGKVYDWRNRDTLKEYIESLGGKVTGSVTSKTNYLINNDSTSTTSKNLTAQKLNIPILTEKDFTALVSDLLAK